jgi:hypothetical protein
MIILLVVPGDSARWQGEPRQLPLELLAEAAANPGGFVAEIDASKAPDPNGYVPAEAILGVFPVGADGVATGEFLRNPAYGPVQDDFELLESPDHWLGWLPDSPGQAVRRALEKNLSDQVAGSRIEWLKVTEEPIVLTGGVRLPDQPTQVIVRRAAVAVPFALAVVTPAGRRDILTGVFSWVAVGLHRPDSRRDGNWLDFRTIAKKPAKP